MRKIIAAINMTLDAFCDHTFGIADDALHRHFTDLINTAGTLLYGRITYRLMEDYWPLLVKNPSGNQSYDDFAIAIDRVPKIVFSKTIKQLQWDTASLADKELKETVLELREQRDGNIMIGSRSLIVALLNEGLIDELQLVVHPVIAGKGLPLFERINQMLELKLISTKELPVSGQMVLNYEPQRKNMRT
jgi:dihydrofolate reductase